SRVHHIALQHSLPYLLPLRRSLRHVLGSNHTPPTLIYTLSLHDALPILLSTTPPPGRSCTCPGNVFSPDDDWFTSTSTLLFYVRSEEHTSELQSRENLVCRLLLENKKLLGLRHVTGAHQDRPALAVDPLH